MTLDYCFFCHDKKHFFVVKGHFCSFLVSSIYWLTSLSTDLRMQLWSCLSFRFYTNFFIHSFLLSEKLLICGNWFDHVASMLFQFSPSYFIFLFCTSSAFQKSFLLWMVKGFWSFSIEIWLFLWLIFCWFLMIESYDGTRILVTEFCLFEGWFSETF